MYFDSFDKAQDKFAQCEVSFLLRNKQKGFALVYLLIAVLILAVLGGAYFSGRLPVKLPSSQPQIPATPIPQAVDEVADWKTYTDTKMGIVFQHPSKWDVVQLSDLSLIVAPLDRANDIKSRLKLGGFGGGKNFTVQIFIENNLQRDAFFSDSQKTVREKEVMIGGLKGTEYLRTYNVSLPGIEEGDVFVLEVVNHKGNNIAIELLDQQYKNIFDQILSTFKFIQ